MKEKTKETLKNVAFWSIIGVAYLGMCYIGIKGCGKLIGKEAAKYIAKGL